MNHMKAVSGLDAVHLVVLLVLPSDPVLAVLAHFKVIDLLLLLYQKLQFLLLIEPSLVRIEVSIHALLLLLRLYHHHIWFLVHDLLLYYWVLVLKLWILLDGLLILGLDNLGLYHFLTISITVLHLV